MSITIRSLRTILATIAVTVVLVLGTNTAQAQTDPYIDDSGQEDGVKGDGSEVLPNEIVRSAAEADANVLPLTGGEIATFTVIGLGLVFVGGAAVVSARRRTHAEV